jgi:hypothetical protein
MLAELAIANAAFSVIKETVQNGGDIMAAGKSVFDFFDNKTKIAKKATDSGSDSEAFFALETIKQNEKQLKELFIYQGRAGLWGDWQLFQVEARKKREDEARAIALKKRKRIQMVKDVFSALAVVLLCITGLAAVLGLVWVIVTKGGTQ